MEVSLKYTNIAQTVIEHNGILIKLHLKKQTRRYLLQYLIGCIILTIGLLTEGRRTGPTEYCDCYHIMTSLGIAWLFMTTLSLIAAYRIVGKARVQIEELAGKYRRTSNEMECTITDETVSYSTPLSKNEIKWAGFQSYALYKHYLFLTIDTSIRSSLVIDMDLLGSDRSAVLLSLVKQKLKTLALLSLLIGCTARLIAQTNPNPGSLHQRMTGNPLEHLPANISVLTSFGERADFSPDNHRVAFMTKSFGDAMVIDLATRKVSCLTCRIPAAAFLRVMHLLSGDYLLIGPDKFTDIHVSRTRDNELWFLSKKAGSKPVKFGIKMSEGVAISKQSMKIAFSQIHDQVEEIPEGASRLIIADVDTSSGTPKIINQKVVYESPDKSCTIEAQDFFDNDTRMTFTCYEPNGLASVMTIDLKTGAVINHSRTPGTYNECEGVFPGGQYTCVEADRQCDWLGGKRGGGNIDIWKLKLDGTGKAFTRLTRFNDYEGGKASNPVISSDGRYMCFQLANTTDPAGVGYGLLLYKL